MAFWRRKKKSTPQQEESALAQEGAASEVQGVAPESPEVPGTRPVPEIVLISAPRSGTNFFCECLDDLPEVMGLYEIFNRGGVYGAARGKQLPVLAEVTGIPAESASDEALVALFRDRPLDGLRALGETALRTNRSVVSYKVFPNQLSAKAIESIVAEGHRHPLILVRSRLDVFVSYEKARQSKTWKNADTSGMKPTVSADDFLEWARGNDEWFAGIADMLDRLGKRYRMLTYREDVDVPKAELLRDLHASLVADGIDVSFPARLPGERFKRQDVRAEPFAKIANGDELRSELEERGMLEYALGEPLSDREGTHGLTRAGA